MKKHELNLYKKFTKEYYDDRDPGHDFYHIKRILNRLEIVIDGIEEEIDYALLYFLACFHGLNKKIESDEDFQINTREFLKEIGWGDSEIESGFISLKRHVRNPQKVEEEIIYDLNYIELLGALGIAKAFTTGGAKGQSFEETINIYEENYLDKVEFRTIYGKKISKEGRDYAKRFLKRLREELGEPHSV